MNDGNLTIEPREGTYKPAISNNKGAAMANPAPETTIREPRWHPAGWLVKSRGRAQ